MNDENIKIDYPRISFPGKIHLITNNKELKAILPDLQRANQLGFDTETKPSFKKGEVFKVALLQLATETEAYLIRLHFVNELDQIKKIFEDENILKVGVAIRDDLKILQKVFQFNPQNFIELQDLAKEKGLQNFGLKGMTEEVLQSTISKGPKMTNWEARELTDPQMLYAATDAWIGLVLYQKLIQTFKPLSL
jgi:ribonuclease D